MASTDVQSQISALRAEIAALQKDLGDRGAEAYETIRDRAGNAVPGLYAAGRATSGLPRLPGTVTETSSSANRPPSWAAIAHAPMRPTPPPP